MKKINAEYNPMTRCWSVVMPDGRRCYYGLNSKKARAVAADLNKKYAGA